MVGSSSADRRQTRLVRRDPANDSEGRLRACCIGLGAVCPKTAGARAIVLMVTGRRCARRRRKGARKLGRVRAVGRQTAAVALQRRSRHLHLRVASKMRCCTPPRCHRRQHHGSGARWRSAGVTQVLESSAAPAAPRQLPPPPPPLPASEAVGRLLEGSLQYRESLVHHQGSPRGTARATAHMRVTGSGRFIVK